MSYEVWLIFGVLVIGGILVRHGTQDHTVLAGVVMLIIGMINLWLYFDLSRNIAELIRKWRKR